MVSPEERQFTRDFVNDYCIARVPPGSKRLPSYQNQGSGYYTWQFYLRAALFNPDTLNVIVKDFLDKYQDIVLENKYQLCGVESASTPLLTGILLEAHKRSRYMHGFSIRKERKPYGLMNWIEGLVLDAPAMLIDDLTSETHKTAIHAAHILDDHGIEMAPHFYAVVFKSRDPERKIRLAGNQVTVGSLFDLNDFELSLQEYQDGRSARNTVAA